MADVLSTGRGSRSALVEPCWRPTGDYRVQCTACDWLRIEQFRRASTRAAKAHVEETGHTVELHRKQYKLVGPQRQVTHLKHGTIDGYYNHGCRCEACKAAGTKYMRDRTARAAEYRPRRSEDA